MAVFRIEKTRDYTVMSNYHLRDRSLSLKAKGMLSLMLSLPEDWDYTMKGLARICKDGIDSISGGIREAGGARLSRPGACPQRERAAWLHRVHHPGAAEGAGTDACAYPGKTYTGKSNTGEANVGCPYSGEPRPIKY